MTFDKLKSLYGQMKLIRLFEQRLLDLFSEGCLFGTTHTYMGQEAIAVAAISQLTVNDTIFSNHRCHGHYLARFDDPLGLLSEIMGKKIGICGGRGGSQHLCRQNFYTSGIQGGYIPIATGMALWEKKNRTKNIVVAFIGDGTLGEGILYESLNMMGLWGTPILLIIENNGYAQSTPIDLNLSGKIDDRVRAFGVEVNEVSSNDVTVLCATFERAANYVRAEAKPFVQIVNTYRLGPHSKGDDFRPQEEIERWRKLDPITILEAKIGKKYCEIIDRKIIERLERVEIEALNAPFAD